MAEEQNGRQCSNRALKTFLVGFGLVLLIVSGVHLEEKELEKVATANTASIVNLDNNNKEGNRGWSLRGAPITGSGEDTVMQMRLRRERYRYYPPSYHGTDLSTAKSHSVCGNGTSPDFLNYFRQNFLHRSANDEDRTLYELLFKNNPPHRGTFIEMGAFDGIRESNTRFFESCLGWEGLLIEANPIIYEKLLENRPLAHRMSFAPSCTEQQQDANQTVSFHAFPWTNAGQAGSALAYANKTVVEVPCGSLTPAILDVFPRGHVTFFSLDVEGAEPLVLNNLDFDRVFIEVVIVENRNNFCGQVCKTRDDARARMKQVGYKRYSNSVRKSDLYIHPLSEFQLDPASPYE